MRDLNRDKSSTIAALTGKQVLITGTTGFLGKVLLEKILRTTPGVGGIYLLMRGNRHFRDATDRFREEVIRSSIFGTLRHELGQEGFEALIASRVHCVTGEITAPRFGLTRADFAALADKLDVVINSAASVNFREELDRALEINTFSLENVAKLCELGGNIPLIHVSTCYVNGYRAGDIHETSEGPVGLALPEGPGRFYETSALIERLQRLVEALRGQYEGRALKAKLIEHGAKEAQAAGWNDTYTFTKWLGEQYLYKVMRGYSLTVVRPSIIESTLREPSPGWIEGVKVADAVLMAYARGKVAFFPGKRAGVIDIIPADLVANAVLLSTAEQLLEPGQHRIYQCCSGGRNPLMLGDFIDHLVAEASSHHGDYDKLFNAPPRRRFTAVDKRVFSSVAMCVKVALTIVGAILRRLGRRGKLRARRNIDTAVELSKIFSFYAQPNYCFHGDKLLSLSKSMGAVDQELFPVDAGVIDWQHYIRQVHMPGLNHYALQGQPSVRAQQRREEVKTASKNLTATEA